MISQKLKWFALIFAVGIVGFFTLFIFRQQLVATLQPSNTLSSIVTLRIDSGDGDALNFSDIPYVTGATAFRILEDITTKEHIPFVYDPSAGAGVFIRQIGDKKNGDSKKYWQYWVNGKYAMVAADQYVLPAGAMIFWKFTNDVPRDY